MPGWTGKVLPDTSAWFKNYAVTPILPNVAKVAFTVKIEAISYPQPGHLGFIFEEQKVPNISLFEPESYPYVCNMWTMGQSITDQGEFNPRVNQKKMNNTLEVHYEV